MYGSLNFREQTVHASLLNLNPEGMALLVKRSPQDDPVILPSARICLEFQGKPPWKCRSLRGTIVHVEPVNLYLLRVGIHLHPTDNQTRTLTEYITQRQAEIMEALDCAYRRTIEPRRVEDLYF
jgi:hypothetical protein